MYVKYFYEFDGLDRVLNRVEILCEEQVSPVEIQGTDSPFILEYPEVKKLEPVKAAGAKIRLVSERIFQFVDLHTDDMQRYVIKFYRGGALYWLGYLDSELYSEDLSAYPPYPVEFSGADFNILERLMYRDEADRRFTGIDTLIGHLKRCFDKLGLPFQKLYIGCSTTAEGITLADSDTVLNQLYVQSSNFYDEDGEAMSCREVVESILEPFGLMMVQRDASVYIYDYNTVKAGDAMKCYDFADFSYKGDVVVNFSLGDFTEIGFASTDATFGFEEMINNVKISCSPYMDTGILEREVKENDLSRRYMLENMEGFKRYTYLECPGWYAGTQSLHPYRMYTDNNSNNTILGTDMKKVLGESEKSVIFSYTIDKDYVIATTGEFYLNIKLDAYVNAKNNPFDGKEEVDGTNAQMLEIRCALYFCDAQGRPVAYYTNYLAAGDKREAWLAKNNFNYDTFSLVFCSKNPLKGNILNNWVTNSNTRPSRTDIQGYPEEISDKFYSSGVFIPLKNIYDLTLEGDYVMNGILKFEITNWCTVRAPRTTNVPDSSLIYSEEKIKDILINNLSLSIVDGECKEIKKLDYEFKSYVNKKVATDFEEKDLKVVSCNEEMIPVGKGNLLALRNNRYELQLRFTRAGQTDILERLLMCTIHSNYTTKNRIVSVDVRMTDNPVMRYVRYDGVIRSEGMLVKGCSLDFDRAVTRVTAADFSGDVMVLSSIPYDE